MSRSTHSARGLHKAKDQAQSAARRRKRRAAQAGNGILHSAQELGSEATTAVKEGLEELRVGAVDYVQQGRRTALRWEEALERRIRDRPLHALLIALGAGLAIGYLSRRS